MHIHRHHHFLLNSSFNQQENNDLDDIDQLSIQQPDTTSVDPVIVDNTDENIIYANINNDDFANQWNISSTNILREDKQINLIAVQQLYTRFLLEMREQHILPQTIIQSITTYIVNLLDIVVDLVEEQAKKKNTSQQPSTAVNVSVNDIRTTIKDIEQAIVFSTRNEYQFLQSCKKFFNYTPPIENLLSSNQMKKEYSYHISIK
ncbi:unnamed protein product [Rotaria sordida]|uniref:Uncharacterized protein n=1 Tax=Rotaria sordida TaxID=392033 RepID=A0A815H423_9BILA|nr:unnamed protein product [Rotaria sordida]CAF1349034.1 unnamed protein product [Rotaria sordida]CAF3986478.1 unnamed protein product [Rotaria sordida]CAF4001228.1 unnamed protein product [Rotaria sordida]